MMYDPVNHPSHYTSGKIEVIDFIEDQKLSYHLGNAVKYICRAGKKDPNKTVEDLRKAVWYLDRYIGMLLKASNEPCIACRAKGNDCIQNASGEYISACCSCPVQQGIGSWGDGYDRT